MDQRRSENDPGGGKALVRSLGASMQEKEELRNLRIKHSLTGKGTLSYFKVWRFS